MEVELPGLNQSLHGMLVAEESLVCYTMALAAKYHTFIRQSN